MALPENLKYSNEHEWVRLDGNTAYIGITDFAQQELGEIVFVEVETVGDYLDAGDVFGVVEAVKTTSDLFMPVSGEVLEFNPDLNEEEGDNPALINEDPYDKGWIIKVKLSEPSELDKLLDSKTYSDLVD